MFSFFYAIKRKRFGGVCKTKRKKLNKCQIFYNNFTKEFVKFPFDTKRLSVMKQVF